MAPISNTKDALTTAPVQFPCLYIPDQASQARLLGLYPQRQNGLWMQRIKILGGVLTAGQWRELARIVRKFTPQTPLHLTTRQDIELHNISEVKVPLVQQALAEVGLTGWGACGDTLRNITVCPCSGLVKNSVDLYSLAALIQQELEGWSDIYALPRKFKISLSCEDDQEGQPWINDLGFIARKSSDQWGFKVIAGGSLGPIPATGIVLFDWLNANDVLPLVAGTIRLFAKHGDRKNRRRARLRHVREQWGDKSFSNELIRLYEEEKEKSYWPQVQLTQTENGFEERRILTFADGNIDPDQAQALAAIADLDDVKLRITNHHRVIVFGRHNSAQRALANHRNVLGSAAKPQAAVVACPGKRWCSRALTHTQNLADKIRTELADKLPIDVTIAISGCPNGCAQTTVADIGLAGRLSRGISYDNPDSNQDEQEVFDLYLGGGMGRNYKLAEVVCRKLSISGVIAEIKKKYLDDQNR